MQCEEPVLLENENHEIQFNDLPHTTVKVLDPDRLENVDRCLYCATKNESYVRKCKHCKKPASWFTWTQLNEK